ncbi:MAG: hypothetical protein U9N86_13565, partial [Bacteroidota bacterium]|nr:hypothetical protein [Bacteroidota bacterium]
MKTNLNNFLVADDIIGFLKEKHDDFVFTHNNVLQYAKDPFCPKCNKKMVMNGFNRYGKKKIGKVKTQRYICPTCKTNHEMSNDVIYGIISNFMKTITNMILKMRSGYLSFECIAETLE